MHIDGSNLQEYRHRNVRVWLDGNEIGDVEVVDEESGYLIQFIKDKQGRYVIDPRNDTLRKCRLEGHVRVTLDGAELPEQIKQELAHLFARDLT